VDRTVALEKRMKAANPEASCIFFPAEEKFMTFVKHRQITGNFYSCKQAALIEAIQVLEGD
jgi:hypothetical protein